MENILNIYVVNLLVILGVMACVWLLSLVLKDASIVDIFWGLGFVTLVWLTCLRADGFVGRRHLMTALVTAWGLRLAVHIGLRNLGKGEDHRYRAWR